MLRGRQNEWLLQEAERLFPHLAADRAGAARTAVWACRAAGGLRQWRRSVLWADRGLALAPDDPETEGILRFSAARALVYIGDLLRAEAELVRFQGLSERTATLSPLVGDALYNMALLRRLLRRPGEEETLFMRAGEAFRRQGRRSGATLCRFEIGWSRLLAGRPEQALPELEAVGRELAEWSDRELQADLSVALALYHSMCGEEEESDQICLRLIREESLTPRQFADAAWVLGSNAVAQGDLLRAADHVTVAYMAAIEDWWPPQIERINALRGRLERRCALLV